MFSGDIDRSSSSHAPAAAPPRRPHNTAAGPHPPPSAGTHPTGQQSASPASAAQARIRPATARAPGNTIASAATASVPASVAIIRPASPAVVSSDAQPNNSQHPRHSPKTALFTPFIRVETNRAPASPPSAWSAGLGSEGAIGYDAARAVAVGDRGGVRGVFGRGCKRSRCRRAGGRRRLEPPGGGRSCRSDVRVAGGGAGPWWRVD